MPARLFVIGTSWNGLQALCELAASLPQDFPAPIFIVQHTTPEGPSRLPEILSRAGRMPALHPQQGELFRPGRIYVAPPDHHMLVRRNYVFLSRGPTEHPTGPQRMFCFAPRRWPTVPWSSVSSSPDIWTMARRGS